jgi:hypothetical protein
MPKYETENVYPPAPVARVTLRAPEGSFSTPDVPLLLDTGADVTLLPRAAVERINVSPQADEQYELVSFDGTKSFASGVVLDLIFLHRTFRGQYLLIEEERGILGRDVLNHAALLLDGPRQQWEEQ